MQGCPSGSPQSVFSTPYCAQLLLQFRCMCCFISVRRYKLATINPEAFYDVVVGDNRCGACVRSNHAGIGDPGGAVLQLRRVPVHSAWVLNSSRL